MKKLLPIILTLTLYQPLKAELPNQVYNTIEILMQSKEKEKIKEEIGSLADKLGNNDKITTDSEMCQALELLISDESQKYITNKIFGEPKTIDKLSIFQKMKIKFKYSQINYIYDLKKTYLNK